jgi:hypothetical protein
MTMRRHVLLLAVITFIATDAVIAQDDALGRLFYTPEQRAALNANIRSVTEQPQERTPVPRSVTLSGVVTRSDGERTVWVDGRAYHQGNPKDIRVITNSTNPADAELKVRGIRERMPVRVGQRLDPASGNTSEPYETPRTVTSEQRRPATPNSGAETASSQSE